MRHTAHFQCPECEGEVTVEIDISRTYRGVEVDLLDVRDFNPGCHGCDMPIGDWADLAYEDYMGAVRDRMPLHPYDQPRMRR